MSKKEAMLDVKARLRTIRRLASPVPNSTAAERLKTIEGIAGGSVGPMDGRPKTSATLLKRLAEGQASRSPRNAIDKQPEQRRRKLEAKEREEAEKKRKGEQGRDRQERGGLNRSADLNR
jgi:hypothetical protein